MTTTQEDTTTSSPPVISEVNIDGDQTTIRKNAVVYYVAGSGIICVGIAIFAVAVHIRKRSLIRSLSRNHPVVLVVSMETPRGDDGSSDIGVIMA